MVCIVVIDYSVFELCVICLFGISRCLGLMCRYCIIRFGNGNVIDVKSCDEYGYDSCDVYDVDIIE